MRPFYTLVDICTINNFWFSQQAWTKILEHPIAIYLPGISEKSRMHSLNPNVRSWSLSCFRMATPMHKGKDGSPRRRVSHKWNTLCKGNTSVTNNQIHIKLLTWQHNDYKHVYKYINWSYWASLSIQLWNASLHNSVRTL